MADFGFSDKIELFEIPIDDRHGVQTKPPFKDCRVSGPKIVVEMEIAFELVVLLQRGVFSVETAFN